MRADLCFSSANASVYLLGTKGAESGDQEKRQETSTEEEGEEVASIGIGFRDEECMTITKPAATRRKRCAVPAQAELQYRRQQLEIAFNSSISDQFLQDRRSRGG